MVGMPCLRAWLPPRLLPVVRDLLAVDAFGRGQGGILIIMVHLCRKFQDKPLRLLKLYPSFVIIGKRFFPFFIQFLIPVFQAYDDI